MTNETHTRKQRRHPKKINADYLKNAGMFYLQNYTASTEHFRRVMMRKINRSCACHEDQDLQNCEDMLAKLILHFQEIGLLDDALYTTGMVTSLRRRGLSKRAIESKLRTKGVPEELIRSTLTKIDQENIEHFNMENQTTPPHSADFRAALTLARRKKIGPYSSAENKKKLSSKTIEERIRLERKALGAFARAGFSYDISKKILDMEEDNLRNLGIDD